MVGKALYYLLFHLSSEILFALVKYTKFLAKLLAYASSYALVIQLLWLGLCPCSKL